MRTLVYNNFKMRKYCTFLIFISLIVSVEAQMNINGQTMYGNEWIDYSVPHIEIKVDQEGLYKLTFQDLVDRGFPAGDLKGSSLQLFNNGQLVGLYVTSESQWSPNDFLIFHGLGNDGWVDSHMYDDAPQQQLNTEVSMFSPERSYFLRLKENVAASMRYTEVANNLGGNLPVLRTYYVDKEMVKFNSSSWSPPTPARGDIHYSHLQMDKFYLVLQIINYLLLVYHKLELLNPSQYFYKYSQKKVLFQ